MRLTTKKGEVLYLLGSQCEDCMSYYFPSRYKCVKCYSEKMGTVNFSNKGTIYSYTIIRTRAPEHFPLPYAIGYVLLENEKIVVPALFQFSYKELETIHIGQSVILQENNDSNKADFIFVPLGSDDQ